MRRVVVVVVVGIGIGRGIGMEMGKYWLVVESMQEGERGEMAGAPRGARRDGVGGRGRRWWRRRWDFSWSFAFRLGGKWFQGRGVLLADRDGVGLALRLERQLFVSLLVDWVGVWALRFEDGWVVCVEGY